jgi:ferric-dicitrate binding protein FerR (iron transport regulator)
MNFNDKDEDSLNFVTTHYRKGDFEAKTSWRRLGIGTFSLLRARRIAAIAAISLAVIAVGTWLFTSTANDATDLTAQVYQLTAPDSNRTFILPDSTVIILAKGSTIDYASANFNNDRNVALHGKAFFHVSKDAAHPFTVKAGCTEVTVLGTKFMVNDCDTANVKVYVESGKVKVKSQGDAKILTRGMSASADSVGVKMANVSSNVLAWATHHVAYDNTPLTQVVAELQDAYGVTIVGNVPKDIKVTLSSDQGINELLDIINELFKTNLKVKSDI